jgi:hypothetical protein
MKALTLIIEGLLIGTLFWGCGDTTTDTVTTRASFEQVSAELDSVMDLFTGDYNTTVSFNQTEAKERGISSDTIALANALANASNEAVSASKGMRAAVYHDELLDWYFNQAAEAAAVMDEDDSSLETTLPATRFSLSTYYAIKYCGTYGRPIPNKSGAWKNIYTADTKEAATAMLLKKGYHATSSTYGGGFTKKVNYNTRYCKAGSFRDHAYIAQQSDGSFIVKEQNYDESYIGGEPNPEIRTYSWPYSVWPAYVLWWHIHY